MAIIKTIDGSLRDKYTATMPFVYDRRSSEQRSSEQLMQAKYYTGGLVRPQFDFQGMVMQHQSFVLEGADTFLRTNDVQAFGKTMLRLRIGEREVFTAPVIGEKVPENYWATYFRHTEFAHLPDGTCACPQINFLQNAQLLLDHLPAGVDAWFQIVLTGYVLNPVP